MRTICPPWTAHLHVITSAEATALADTAEVEGIDPLNTYKGITATLGKWMTDRAPRDRIGRFRDALVVFRAGCGRGGAAAPRWTRTKASRARRGSRRARRGRPRPDKD